MGEALGWGEGLAEGPRDGAALGPEDDGAGLGAVVIDGEKLGNSEGLQLGDQLGLSDGLKLGDTLGFPLGEMVGLLVGEVDDGGAVFPSTSEGGAVAVRVLAGSGFR